MPQGVEHADTLATLGEIEFVLKPLMPQGVEHTSLATEMFKPENVLKPLMPQGVEHLVPKSILTQELGAKTSDAARR